MTKIALITDSAAGIGESVASHFDSQGYQLILVDKDAERNEALAARYSREDRSTKEKCHMTPLMQLIFLWGFLHKRRQLCCFRCSNLLCIYSCSYLNFNLHFFFCQSSLKHCSCWTNSSKPLLENRPAGFKIISVWKNIGDTNDVFY